MRRAKRGGERVILSQWQDRERLDARSCDHPGDVDSLAPGILARRGRRLNLARLKRGVEGDRAIQRRVRGDGDDPAGAHASHTSTCASDSAAANTGSGAASVTRTSMASSGAKLTSSSSPELVGVGDDDDAARRADDRRLDGGFVGIGGAQAEGCRDAVRAEERDVGAQVLDRTHGVGTDGGRRGRAHTPSDDGEVGIRRSGQSVSQGHRVGDDLDSAARAAEALRQLRRDGLRRCAGVEVHRSAEPLVDELERAMSDRGLRRAAPV